MEKRELTCIGCPLGCSITVTMENAEILDVTGNTCKRGDAYARKEVTHPTRIVTSTVRVSGGTIPMVSCKTKEDIPKEKILQLSMLSVASLFLHRSLSEIFWFRTLQAPAWILLPQKMFLQNYNLIVINDSHHSDKYLFQGNNCFGAPVSD